MPAAGYCSPFAALSLTLDEKEELSRLADRIVSETMAMNERFLWQDQGCLDPAIWTVVREREHMRVYHNAFPGAGTRGRDMHRLLTVGTMAGTLNDVMYGMVNPTTEASRIKSAYVKDTLLDMAVLESVVQPTRELPFESMAVRWLVKGMPRLVRLVVKHHDCVYLETTGIRHLSNGERVGIQLLHSITLAQTPCLPQYDRFNMSVCTIWRHMAPDTIQCYSAGYFEIEDSFKATIVVRSMADLVVSVGQAMGWAQQKKLTWLVQNKILYCETTDQSLRPPKHDCAVCGSHDRSARRGKSACAICDRHTCQTCRMPHTLRLFAPDGQLLQYEVGICMPCLLSAKELNAVAFAQEDASAGYAGLIGDPGSIVVRGVSLNSSLSTRTVSCPPSGDAKGSRSRRARSFHQKHQSKTLSLYCFRQRRTESVHANVVEKTRPLSWAPTEIRSPEVNGSSKT